MTVEGNVVAADGDPPRTSKPRSRRRRWVLRAVLVICVLLATVLFWVWWNILRIQEDSAWPPVDGVTSAGAEQATEAFVARGDVEPSDAALVFAPSRAATSQPWVDGQTYFPKILDDVERATSSVNILMYGWKDGQIGRQFVTAVEDRIDHGVEVRVIVDSHGSLPFDNNKAMYDELVAAGAHVVVNDSLTLDQDGELGNDRRFDWGQEEFGHMDHRKLFVIDGQIMWVGGSGIEDHFNDGRFHDVMTRLTGDVVRQAQAAFLTSFDAYGGSLPTGPGSLAPYFPEPEVPGTLPAILTQNIPGGFVNATQEARELIDTAQDRLDIVNPYITDDDVIDRIAAAAQRGVAVRVMTSQNSNNPTTQHAFEHHYADLEAAGVKVYLYPGAVVHAKVIVSDDRVSIGTLNLDAWALYRNSEIQVTVDDPLTVAALDEQLFDVDIAKCTLAQPPTGLLPRLKAWWGDTISYFI
jgi:cardiolipin synthase A/B